MVGVSGAAIARVLMAVRMAPLGTLRSAVILGTIKAPLASMTVQAAFTINAQQAIQRTATQPLHLPVVAAFQAALFV